MTLAADPSAAERLRSAGLRVTRSRLAVLDSVAATPHRTADELVAQVRTRLGSGSTQAVYDALHTMTEHRLLRRFEPAGSSMRFELWTSDNHHHLVCRRCGLVTDVACRVGSAPCAEPSDASGYRVLEAEVTYWGLCSSCSAVDDDAPPTRAADRGRTSGTTPPSLPDPPTD